MMLLCCGFQVELTRSTCITKPVDDYIDAALTTVLQIHLSGSRKSDNNLRYGDVLVFLTGQEDIESLCQLLRDRAKSFPHGVDDIIVQPIYASLPWDKQAEVFRKTPKGCRKIVVATNIAETSITIDGIGYVVDAGLVKMKGHHMNTGMEYLRTVLCPRLKLAAEWLLGKTMCRQSYRLYPVHYLKHSETSAKQRFIDAR